MIAQALGEYGTMSTVLEGDLPGFFGPIATGERRRFEGTGFLGPLRG